MNGFGLLVACGAVTAIFWLSRRTRGMGVTENEFWAALWLMVVGAIIGAKGLFVVLGWRHFTSGELRFWSDFQTGFVFFGGFSGAAVAGALFAWWRRLDFWRGADYFAVALPLGHAIGRVGCFVEGCCPGVPPHPVQLYEAGGLLVLTLVGRSLLQRIETGRSARGTAFCGYVAGYGLLRLLLDPLRSDGVPGDWLGWSLEQGLALALMLAGLATWQLRRARGTVTGGQIPNFGRGDSFPAVTAPCSGRSATSRSP